jgi:tRNA (guanine37-N1)-methyltransferase
MTRKKTKALCVPLQEAEPARRYLREHGLLREDVEILKEAQHIFLPVNDVPEKLASYEIFTKSFKVKCIRPQSYKDLAKVPRRHREALPTSYDVVGDIILLKLPKILYRYRKEIGDALLKTHHHVRTVCLIDAVSGELRTRKVSIIAGENRTLTSHTEYGLTFHVDVAQTYFSPRLASERRRVAGLVQKGETIVDMFAGVAPFSIMIARFADPGIVYAVDKNEAAVRLARVNVTQNHVLEKVDVVLADARDVEKLIPKKADRVIMNLPFSAHRFFSQALAIAADTCIIHYYDIIKEEDVQARMDALRAAAADQSFVFTGASVRKIKSYAPREFYIGIDITARKRADVA